MATSRSLGARSFTTSPPIRSSPSVMSSSPATMRRAVDLPQPEGPTSITNSPSAMSRSMARTASKPSGKRLVRPSIVISAIGYLLSLHRAGGETRHDAALEDQDHDDDWNCDDYRGRGDRPDGLLELRGAGEESERGRNRPRIVGRGERVGEDEVVPREDEDEDRRREDPRSGERHDHLAERLHRRRPIHRSGLLELPGNLAEERGQRVDRERQREGHVGDDQPGPGVVDADRPPHVEERADDRDRREHGHGERTGEDQRLAREVES